MPTIQQLVRKGRELWWRRVNHRIGRLSSKTWRLRTCLHYDSEET